MGLPKTGTTAFQEAVHAENIALLSEQHTLYPGAAANHTDALCTMFLPDPRTHITNQMAGVTTERQAEQLRQKTFSTMEKALSASSWQTLLLSAEGASNLSDQPLANLRDWLGKWVDRVEVIYVVRHPIDFTVSVMQQMLKGGYTIDGMMENIPHPQFQSRLSRAFNVFGRERVRVLCYEDARNQPGGLIAALCGAMAIREPACGRIVAAQRDANESLPMLAARTLDSMNRQRPLFINGKLNPKRTGREAGYLTRLQGSKFNLRTSEFNLIREVVADDTAWLEQVVGIDYDLSKTTEPPEERYNSETIDSLALLISDLANGQKK